MVSHATQLIPGKVPSEPESGATPVGDPILDAAANCVRRKGFDIVSLEEVASEAGVSRTTLYRRFGNRESLFAAILWARSAPFRKWSRAVIAGPGTVAERLETVIVHATLQMQRVSWLDESFRRGLSPLGIRLLQGVHVQGADEGIGPLIDAALALRPGFPDIQRNDVLEWLVGQMIRFASAPPWDEAPLRRQIRFFVLPAITVNPANPSLVERLDAIDDKIDRLLDRA
jgi:AcrR family transcriptional regulator